METPADRLFIKENKKERERLRQLVNEMTDEELSLVIYEEGWTIAVVLAHLAFGDQRTLQFLKKWRQISVTAEPPLDINHINDALLPLFLAIPPRVAAGLAVSLAETLDCELEEAAPDMVKAMEELAPGRLHRAPHRKRHLDEIEALLKTARRKTG
ncbi:MAG TPA: hypothetical protein G4O16_06675 [Dehalococcoidia bacterium]|nr:hypothetical protein [Dehalococcoidia bacterium]